MARLTIRPETLNRMTSDELVAMIQSAVAALERRGSRRLAIEAMLGEQEDLALAQMGPDALANRARGLDLSIENGGLAP